MAERTIQIPRRLLVEIAHNCSHLHLKLTQSNAEGYKGSKLEEMAYLSCREAFCDALGMDEVMLVDFKEFTSRP